MAYSSWRKWQGALAAVLMIVLVALPVCALGVSYPTLRLDDENDDVLEMQTELEKQGYYTGSLTGHFGSKTEDAVKKFQRANGLSADGIAGPRTLEMLYEGSSASSNASSSASSASSSSSSTVLKEGAESDAVLQLQTNLQKLGYYTGSLTGHFGSRTEEAVKKFQRANGLSADGIAGANTLAKMQSVLSGSAGASSNASSSSGVSTAGLDLTTTLHLNSKSATVTALQTRLKELKFYTGNITGNYGQKTMAAVKAFQKKNGLTADGLAGAKTLSALFSATAIATDSAVSVSVSASKVQNVNWYTMRGKYKDGITVTVYDFDTGLSWNLKTMSKDKHWDMEPVTATDVTTMYKAFGNKETWTPKAVWVTFPDGATYIASTANSPHGTYHISGNNFKGHLCVHFPLSMEAAEKIGPNAVSFQKAITNGWEATQKLTGK